MGGFHTGPPGAFPPGGSNLNQVYNRNSDSWTVGAAMPTARGGTTVAVVMIKFTYLGGQLWQFLRLR